MVRQVTYALFIAAFLCGLVAAEEFFALVGKVKDGKVSFRKWKRAEGKKSSTLDKEESTLPVAEKGKVFNLVRKRDKDKKVSFERGEELPDGLANEQLKKRLANVKTGILARIITDDNGKKITEVQVMLTDPAHQEKHGGPGNVDRPRTPETPDEANLTSILMGMKKGRDQLRTGVFRAHGVYRQIDKREGNWQANVEMYCAFDRPNNKIRFDRSLPGRILLPPTQGREANPQPVTVIESKTKVIITPSQVLSTEEGRGSLDLYSPDQKEAQRINGRPFDVRCLGLYYMASFRSGLSFELLHQNLAQKKPSKVERNPDGKWTIVWEFPGPPLSRLTLWVDESQGFTVIRSEGRYARRTGGSLQWQEPKEISDVTWALDQGVWLPKTFVIKSVTPTRTVSYDLAFTWESINQPVSEALFTKEGLDIRERTVVCDHTTGEPVITEILNDDPDHASYHQQSETKSVLHWILLVNVIVLAILAAFFLYKRRSAKKTARIARPDAHT